MYAIYENKGVLDIRALTIMGLNAKEKADAIGFFGTGIKNAFAVLARNGCSVTIQTGEVDRVYELRTRPDNFRGKEFMQLELHEVGVEFDVTPIVLPYTTELGKTWEMWMALREVECNLRDEDGTYYSRGEIPQPREGFVRIIIGGAPYLRCVHDERSKVFYDIGNKVEAVRMLEEVYVRHQETNALYYRGILINSCPKGRHWACEYSMNEKVDLTEDRTLKFSWVLDSRVSRWFRFGSPEYRKRLLDHPEAYEWDNIANEGLSLNALNDAIVQELRDHRDAGGDLHEWAEKMVIESDVRRSMQTSATLDEHQSDMYDLAISRLIESGYPVDEYTIKVVSILPKKAFGMADFQNKTILISTTCFEHGLENLMGTMLEEWAHLKFHFNDLSREFQDWLLRQSIIQIQRRIRDRKRSNVESST